MSKKIKLVIILGIIMYLFIIIGQEKITIETQYVLVGYGCDIEKKDNNKVYYKIPHCVYVFNTDGTKSSTVLTGTGSNIAETRQDRQRKSNNKYSTGLERIVVFSEDYARYGIKQNTEVIFNNIQINDSAFQVVCKGSAEDMLKYKVEGYASSADYLYGLIKSLKNYNFFSENYKSIDSYVRLDSEGRNLVLPYVEITENGIEVTGLAIFDKYNMKYKTDIQDTRILNLLREDGVKGILSLSNSQIKGTDLYVNSKRKVNCHEIQGKYYINIDLSETGDIVTNEIYKNINLDIKQREKFERDMEEKLKKQCEEFIYKMQNEYKLDCLELGRNCAAVTGRNKNIDWDKVISDADIKINVKVKVEGQLKGDY